MTRADPASAALS